MKQSISSRVVPVNVILLSRMGYSACAGVGEYSKSTQLHQKISASST